MIFSCLKENLLKGFNIAGHLALKSTSLPILNSILLRADKNILTLTTTNLEAGITHEVRGKTEKSGECLLSAKLLLELAPLLPEGTIELNFDNKNLAIKGDKIKTNLHTASVAEFPIIPTIDKPQRLLSVATNQLINALDKTLFATSRVDNKPQFGGLLLMVEEKDKKRLVITATDGYRLSELSLLLTKPTDPCKLILPSATAQEVRRILTQDGAEEAVDMQTSDNQINLVIGSTQIISRLIDGEYPDYQPLFPEKQPTECEVEKNALIKAIKAASLFSRSGIFDISLAFTPNGVIEVFSENTTTGSHHTIVEAQIKGAKTQITINARYLLDGIGAITGETVKIFLNGSEQPILLKSNKEEETRFRHLIVLIKQT